MCDGNGVCSCKPNFINVKCDQCNIGFFNFPLCEGNQCINSTLIKLELIFFSKLAIVMNMVQMVILVMTMVYVVVRPISRGTNVTHVILAFIASQPVKVCKTNIF